MWRQPQPVVSKMSQWWRSVLIGSVRMSGWVAADENVSLEELLAIFKKSENTGYILVVKSLVPLEVVGIITRESLEAITLPLMTEDTSTIKKALNQFTELMSTNYKLMLNGGGTIGDLEDALVDGTEYLVLYRNTHVLSPATEGNNNSEVVIQRQHVISVFTEPDLKRWITEIENHHNIA